MLRTYFRRRGGRSYRGRSATSEPVRVVVDPGSHDVLNLGDVAMLQVAVRRLREHWPSGRIDVLTGDAAALARHCPGATPLPAAGRYAWFAAEPRNVNPGGVRATRAALRARLSLRRVDAATREYLDALLHADLFLVAGRGGLCDPFLSETREVLAELDLAQSIGVPTALTSQGVGPLTDPDARARAARSLARVGLIAVRERLLAPRLLAELGVPASRVLVTGDDAVEPARALADGGRGDAVGLSLRLADYSGLDRDAAREVATAVRTFAGEQDAQVAGIPVSLYPGEAEAGTLRDLLGDPAAVPDMETPDEAMRAAGRCRAVVTGTYHAAVFAAAQGVPVVGLVTSPYYAGKLGGLRDLFGPGVTLVDSAEPDLGRGIVAALAAAWSTPPAQREQMRASADRQIASARAAYAELPPLVRPGGGRRAAIRSSR